MCILKYFLIFMEFQHFISICYMLQTIDAPRRATVTSFKIQLNTLFVNFSHP